MFSFFRRRKEADATARRIIDQGRFLGARTPRDAVEMLWGRPLGPVSGRAIQGSELRSMWRMHTLNPTLSSVHM